MLCKGQAEPCNALCTTASKEWKLSLPAVWLTTRKTADPRVLQFSGARSGPGCVREWSSPASGAVAEEQTASG
jgi:hypothetical protein